MKRVLLDTSAYSALLRGHIGVSKIIQRAEEILLIPIVLGELRAGFRLGRRAKENEELLRQFMASKRCRRLLIDDETADRYALILTSLRALGRPIPTNDVWIAAAAMQTGSYLVTLDQHFRSVPQIAAEILEVE